MRQIVECVPNFSEGRDRTVIEAIAAEISGTPGAVLLDVDAGAATSSMANTLAIAPIHERGTEEQKQKYLPGCVSGEIITAIAMTEPNTGSDLAAIKTTAVEQGDERACGGIHEDDRRQV